MSFDDALIPLKEFIHKIDLATGVPLTLDPSLDNLKIDAYLEDKAVGITLSKVSDVFDLEWQTDGNGYKLTQSKASNDQMNSYIKSEDQLVREVVEKQIAVYRLINELVPRSKKRWYSTYNRFEGWKTARDNAKSAMEEAKENGAASEKLLDLEIKYDALNKISEGKPNLQLARIFGKMTPLEIGQYEAGKPFIGSNVNEARFPYSYGDIRPNDALPYDDGIKSVMITRIDPGSKRVGAKDLTFSGNSIAMTADPASHYPFDEIASDLIKMPFAKKLMEWDQVPAFAKNLTKSMNVDSDYIQGWKSPWSGGRFRLGDHLRWFHLVTGVPVIAPANRTIHPFIKLYRGPKTQGDYLNNLLKACHGYGRKSDDYLLVRDGVYWRKAIEEIPESTYAKVESRSGGKLSLKSLASFATNITRTQAMQVQDPNGVVIKFSRNNFGEAYPTLQFLDSLSDEQISLATSDNKALTYPMLFPEQRPLFEAAVVEGLIDRGFVSQSLLGQFVINDFSLGNIPNMRFRIRRKTVFTTFGPETADDEGETIELVPKRVFPKRQVIDLEFSYNPANTITFSTEDL